MEDPIVDDLKFSLSDKQKIKKIREEVILSSRELKQLFPILQHQNAIGMSIMLFAVSMIVTASYFFLTGHLSPWILVTWNAFWMAILHELEHDTIHYMYFKKNKAIQNFMLLTLWVFRPTTINPWFRRHLHFNHHRVSGTKADIEERSVTNGEPWSMKRLISTPDLILGGILRMPTIKKDIIEMVKSGQMTREEALTLKRQNALGFLPFGIFIYIIWYVFVIHYLLHGFCSLLQIPYTSPHWIQAQFTWINPLVAILIAPNMLRQFCLHFITSNMHYYGDVEPGNIMQQTQILNIWWLIPLQLFCFNFGSTHAIHHFVVGETFYIRQLTAARAHRIMLEMGVRCNDLSTFSRANRFTISR